MNCRFYLIAFLFSFCSATFASSLCEGLLVLQKDYFDSYVAIKAPGAPLQKVSGGDVLQIAYKNGAVERVVLNSQRFSGPPGHGEPPATKNLVFIPAMIDGITHEVLRSFTNWHCH